MSSLRPADYQAQYLRGDPGALALLYLAIAEQAKPVCWALAVRQCRITIDQDRVIQVAHDAAARIIERYLRHAHYRIRSWSPVIRLEVLHALTEGGHGDRPTKREIDRAGALLSDIESPPTRGQDPSGYLQDLLGDHDRGRDLVLALVLSSTYRKAISENQRHVRRGSRIYAGREYEEFVESLAKAVIAARLQALQPQGGPTCPLQRPDVLMAFRIGPHMDAQNLIKPVCDALERGGVVANDRHIGSGHWFPPERRRQEEPDEIRIWVNGGSKA